MPYRDVKTLSARGQIQLKFAKRAAKLVHVYQCLIVSADPTRRDMFERAAAEGGWKTFLCADAPSALTLINRTLVQLAVVDLQTPESETFHPVVEQFTGASGLLLVVCGNEGKVEEEVWVRQLGAWLYLPGEIDGGNFALLCGEAKHITERLSKASNAERGLGSAVAQRNGHS